MAHNTVTLSDLDTRLLERLGGQGRFWSPAERRLAINEALAVWQLLTGEFVKSRSVTYNITSNNLIDQTTIDDPYAGTLRVRCTPNPLFLTIAVVDPTVETECDPPVYATNVELDIATYGGGSGVIDTYEWRDYVSADPEDSFTPVSTDPNPATFYLGGGDHYIRLFIVDTDANEILSSNYLHFCLWEPI